MNPRVQSVTIRGQKVFASNVMGRLLYTIIHSKRYFKERKILQKERFQFLVPWIADGA